MSRSKTFVVGRRKGGAVSVWLVDPAGSEAPVPALPWRVRALVAGPVRAAAAQAPVEATRRRSSAIAPAPDPRAARAASTPASRVGAVPAA
jgi:hypothetical protein